MDERKIIFQLKDGVTIDEMRDIFSFVEDFPNRLYEIQDKLNIYSEKAPEEFRPYLIEEADKLFDELIYPFLSDTEKQLYRTYVIKVDTERALRLFRRLERSKRVDYVQYALDYVLQYAAIEPSASVNPGLTRIECPTAWYTSTGEGVVVAIVDSGVDYRHNYLINNMWDGNALHGDDFVAAPGQQKNTLDRFGHGTLCAGIVSAANDSLIKVSVAPMAKIMAVKIFDRSGTGVPVAADTVACANAIKFAADNKAKVISNSWTAKNPHSNDFALRKGIDHAYSQGCIMVFAAGNQGVDIKDRFPASYEKVISVAGTTDSDGLLNRSNFGELITIAAPGEKIISLRYETLDQISEASGTSMACPHVAGVIALLFEINKNFTFCQIKDILIEAGVPISVGVPLGKNRRVNAAASVKRAVEIAKTMLP